MSEQLNSTLEPFSAYILWSSSWKCCISKGFLLHHRRLTFQSPSWLWGLAGPFWSWCWLEGSLTTPWHWGQPWLRRWTAGRGGKGGGVTHHFLLVFMTVTDSGWPQAPCPDSSGVHPRRQLICSLSPTYQDIPGWINVMTQHLAK